MTEEEEKVEVVFTEPFKFAYGGRYVVEYEPSEEPVAVSARCAEVAIEIGAARELGAEGEKKAATKKAAKK